MEDVIRMSEKERRRLVEVVKVAGGEESIRDAAVKLGLSYRQMKRSVGRYRAGGDRSLCHKSRGRPSNRRIEAGIKGKMLEIYEEQFLGWGPTLAAEKLSDMGYNVDHETLRRWLCAQGLWKRARKRKPCRRRRERKAHFGELVQIDGSPHDWFGTGEKACLMDMADDATGMGLWRFFPSESSEAAMVVAMAWVKRYGAPCALYSDRHTIYHTKREATLLELERGERPLTAFGKACAKLGIEIIPASSPQAKGRVERRNGVLQDRLAKELQWRGIRTIEAANAFLDGGYIDAFNARFAKEPESPVDYHRALPKGTDLDGVFAIEEERAVGNDWTVRYQNQFLQITGPGRNVPPAKSTVTVQERLNGDLRVYYRGEPVSFEPIGHRPIPPKPEKPSHKARKRWIPPPDHPWRGYRQGNKVAQGSTR